MFLLLLGITPSPAERDRQFMIRLYRTHGSLMYRQAMAVLASEADAQDALSDAFIALIENISTLKRLSGFALRSYAVITVKHKALDMLRRRREVPWEDMDGLQGADPEPGPEARLLALEDVAAAAEAIGRLPSSQRQLMEMKYLRGLDNTEIARELGISADAVRAGLSKARKRLRALVAQEGEEAHDEA